MKFVDRIKKLVGNNKSESEVDRSDDRGTIYKPIEAESNWVKGEKPKNWASTTTPEDKPFDVLLNEFKDKPSPETLKPLESFLDDSLKKSTIQHAIKDLPEAKCSPEAKQSLQKQVGDAIIKMATSQHISR